MSNKQCIHHWVIDEFNVGRCKKCPAVRDFNALLKKEGANIVQARVPSGKRGRSSKRQLLVGAMIQDAERNDNGNE